MLLASEPEEKYNPKAQSGKKGASAEPIMVKAEMTRGELFIEGLAEGLRQDVPALTGQLQHA